MGDPRDHYVELDALRGIAILGVVMSHVATYWMNAVKAPLTIPLLGVDVVNLLLFGTQGVILFFLLSGYLLTWTEEKRARSGIYSVRSYVIRRALRLVPAYYVAILIVIILWPIPVSAMDVLMHASFLHALNPYTVSSLDPTWWSLTPEVVFYCLLPFIVLKLPRVSQRLALLGVFALISLTIRLYLYTAQVTIDPANPNLWHVLAATTMYLLYYPAIFLAGVLLRMLVEYLNTQPASWLRLQLATALFLISAISMVVLLYLGLKHPTIARLQEQPSAAVVGVPVDLLAIAFFASAVLGSPLLRAVLLKWRFLAFTGVISYSLFLLHSTVFMVAMPHLLPVVRYWVGEQGPLAVWAAFSCYTLAILAVGLTLSYFSYRYIESPFLSYKPK